MPLKYHDLLIQKNELYTTKENIIISIQKNNFNLP